ncbi:hypothetical protein JTB14_010477 [Gonioctena quinquepunctata]|nr:hypothetical protein JTB14_010477 [Gonioctena quinquepunctata]
MENINITFPDIFPYITEDSPWSVKISSCNTSLMKYDKSNTNPNVIKNALNDILDTNHIASENIFTDASKSIEEVGCAVVSSHISQYKLSLLSSIHMQYSKHSDI